jgi:hypothetical protein
MDEKTRWYTIPTAGLEDLPPCPLAGRVTSGSDMNDFPTGMMNDEKDIDRPEEDCLDAEEVTGSDFVGVRGEKTSPDWRWFSLMDASHVLGDGPCRDREAQSCQLRVDTFLSPQDVLGRHATNERLHLGRNRLSP